MPRCDEDGVSTWLLILSANTISETFTETVVGMKRTGAYQYRDRSLTTQPLSQMLPHTPFFLLHFGSS